MITHSGHEVDPARMSTRDVRIVDVARGLAARYMWRGHSRDLMTFAEHHVILSQMVRPELALQALLRAGCLAYVDPTHACAKDLQWKVWTAFGVKPKVEEVDEITRAEQHLFAREAIELWDEPPKDYGVPPAEVAIARMPPTRAEHVFSAQFCELYGGWS